MNIGILPIGVGGCSYYRLLIPLRKLEEKYKDKYKVHACFTHDLNCINERDKSVLDTFILDKNVVIIQRRTGDDWESFAKGLKLKGIIVVYEIDDCYAGIPLENLKLNARYMCNTETQKSVHKMLNIADVVTVSTPELKEWCDKFCDKDKVHILKNTLDFSLWPSPHYGIHNEGESHIIGFAGAEAHKTDLRELNGSLEILNRQLNDLKETIIFGFFGFMLEEFWNMSPHVRFKLGVPFLEYPDILSKLRFNVGLAPLKQCVFNRCKSELRFLEHAACGVPVVATDIAPFRRCITPDRGILVDNNSRKWVSAIKDLINDEKKRGGMGRNSYDYVKKEYNIDIYVNEWDKLYSTFN